MRDVFRGQGHSVVPLRFPLIRLCGSDGFRNFWNRQTKQSAAWTDWRRSSLTFPSSSTPTFARKIERCTNDHVRHGTTSLFAALNT